MAASYGSEFADARGFGWTCEDLRFDWPTLIRNVRREVDRLNGVYTRTLGEGWGRPLPHPRRARRARMSVKLAERDATLSAKTILVATGSHPMIPDLPGKEHLISSNECFELEQLPEQHRHYRRRLYRHGVRLDLRRARRRGDRALSRRPDLARLRHGSARRAWPRRCAIAASISAWIPTWPRSRRRGAAIACKLKRGDSIAADLVMAATGRVPNTIGLGLEQVGVELGWNGRLVVDEFSKSSVDNIYAVGDVTDRMNLTPVAIHEANAFAETLFNDNADAGRSRLHPDGGVLGAGDRHGGLTEEKAREMYRGRRYLQDRASGRLRSMVSGRDEKMLMKLVVDMETRQGARRAISSAAMRPRSCRWRRSRSGSARPRRSSTRPWRCIRSAAEELVTMRHKWEAPAPVAGSDAAA